MVNERLRSSDIEQLAEVGVQGTLCRPIDF